MSFAQRHLVTCKYFVKMTGRKWRVGLGKWPGEITPSFDRRLAGPLGEGLSVF
jgi:hypothetical protein